MEGVLLFVFMGLVFGGMYALMAYGYNSIERDRAGTETPEPAREVLEEPRFFASMRQSAPGKPETLIPVHLVDLLEQRLQNEYLGATAFAAQPSKEGICSAYGAYVDAVASDLERHIRRESAATTAFVAKPSVKRLYSDVGNRRSRMSRR
ncbi:MAG: hypothetical protein GTN89_16395 [Acidobacteria bacterium]|nr:hypothetical protein [Acidobacteriota bacterium]NIO60806.1 hypothetical protein [Acidobacteriota bacterium]NIQ31878.1 hypothetical protein [Acidobacteriota bacterium]NIQ87258.1 hypothetical protein [Acidobacteriota bacterium]NIT12474.1 hypothetical protein [Acidobacteriota bacterium]